MKEMQALVFRKKFGSVLDEVVKKRTPIVVSRLNKPLVVLVPYEEYERENSRDDRERRLRAVGEEMNRLAKKMTSKARGIDSTKFVRQMRDSRWPSWMPR